ncbi:hypothetical protein B0H10DRAFT_2013356 [Mycena sp. CBHHK59/15]|nr:hypothetical protein B0H10DRAFT_2013356 [Mycena sp. CBHHK59/15]
MIPWRAILRLLPARTRADEYQLLPDNTAALQGSPRRRRPFSLTHVCCAFSLRRLCLLLAVILVLLVCGVLLSGIPPSYADIRAFEAALPQHNLSLAAQPDGPRYLRFPDHLWGHGLNNVLQEAILMGYLAHRAGRAYVFEDYTWSHSPLPYTLYDFALRPAHIPLNAFVAGPLAGGPLPGADQNDIAKRAVSAAFYSQACPRATVHTLSSTGAPNDADGAVLLDWWLARLADVPARCVEIESSTQPVFDFSLFGSSRLLSLLPGLASSPVLAAFSWSPLVHSAVARNFALLRAPDPAALYPFPSLPSSSPTFPPVTSSPPPTLTSTLGLHLRRGDYSRHCPRLALWGATYLGANQHPALPDRFDAPANASAAERTAHYMQHCYPDAEAIARRLGAARAAWAAAHPEAEPLSRVYILTNGWGWFVKGVRAELMKDGWAEVRGSADMLLDGAQREVGMAVDMRVGEGVAVFVGNGFSSLTSNIVMLRMARGLDPASNRFL